MNIFYRFYQNNFIRGIVDCIKNKKIEINIENDLINKMILKIIQNCDQNQIEIVQELKGDYPFLLRYHMIEILSQNAFLFQVENQEKYLKKEAYQLFENFKDLKIPFKYQLNYLSFYPNHEIFTVDNVNDIDKLVFIEPNFGTKCTKFVYDNCNGLIFHVTSKERYDLFLCR